MSGTTTPPLLTEDDSSLAPLFGGPEWGIFTPQGQPLLAVDSIGDIDYNRDYDISDYTQEQGAWESYNKVQTPFMAKIGFLLNANRIPFLQSIEAACASLALVTVATPEVSYPSANLIHYGLHRSGEQGVSLVRVDVWAREVRITAGTQLNSSTAATPSGNGASTSIGQPNSSAVSASPLTPPTNTQSTNGASPTSTGQTTPQAPGSTNPSTGNQNPTTLTPPNNDLTQLGPLGGTL